MSLSSIGGLNAASAIRKARGNEVFIIGVGWFSVSLNLLAYMNGCDEFISKPFDLKFILELIRDRLGNESLTELEGNQIKQKNNKVH